MTVLGDLVTLQGGGTPARNVPEYWNGDIPWASVKDLNVSRLKSTEESISEAGVAASATNVIRAGHVIVATRMAVGRASLLEVDAAINQDLKALLPKPGKRVHPNYLLHLLGASAAFLEKRATGATVKGIRGEVLENLPVPHPDYEEQRRIADILDKADAIRRKRKEAIALTEELLRSAFLEMFGDPVTNPKSWPVKPLARLGRITTGNTPSRAVPAYFGDDIEWIKSDNINTPSHYLTRATEGLSAQGRAVGRTVPAGSTLMTCIAGSPDCIGNVALADREVAFNQQINAVTPHDGVDYRFLYVLLLVGKRLVQAASTNSMKGMVSKGKLEDVLVPAPPPKAQAQFGEAFDRVLRLSRRQEAAQSEAQTLFDTTVQRAFAGELAS